MVFDATFSNISVISFWSVLLVEETGVPCENHHPVESHVQTLSQNAVLVQIAHVFVNSTTMRSRPRRSPHV